MGKLTFTEQTDSTIRILKSKIKDFKVQLELIQKLTFLDGCTPRQKKKIPQLLEDNLSDEDKTKYDFRYKLVSGTHYVLGSFCISSKFGCVLSMNSSNYREINIESDIAQQTALLEELEVNLKHLSNKRDLLIGAHKEKIEATKKLNKLFRDIEDSILEECDRSPKFFKSDFLSIKEN